MIAVLWWCLGWCTFEDAESIGTQLLAMFTSSLFDWSHAWWFLGLNCCLSVRNHFYS